MAAPAALPPGMIASAGESTLALADLRRHVVAAATMRVAEACPSRPAPCTLEPDPALVERLLDSERITLVVREYARRNGIRLEQREIDEALTTVAGRSGFTAKAFLEQVNGTGVATADYRESLGREVLARKAFEQKLRSSEGPGADTHGRDDDFGAWIRSLDAEYHTRVELPPSERRALDEAALRAHAEARQARR